MRLAILAAVLSLICASACSGPSEAQQVLDQRRQWWADQIKQFPDATRSLESLSVALQELDASERLHLRNSENGYSAKLETFEAEELPCGYADLKLDVVVAENGTIDQLMIGASFICGDAQND